MKTLSMTLLGAASAVLLTVPATAHPRLVASSPVAGGTAHAPAAIMLKFSEKLLAAFSGLSITPLSGGGKAANVLKTSVLSDGRTLVVSLAAPLQPGSYLIGWHVVSSDTHRVAGSLRFTAR